MFSRRARRVRPKWGQTSGSTAKHTQRGGSSACVESFLAPWFVCLRCVVPGPWCVGPACASGFWSCRLVLLAGLALWLRRPGLSPSGGLLVWPCLLVSSWPCSSFFSKEATTQGTDPKTGCFEGEATTQGPIFKQVSPLTAVTVFYGRGIGGIGLCFRFSVFLPRLFSSRASMVFQSVLAFSEVLRKGVPQ